MCVSSKTIKKLFVTVVVLAALVPASASARIDRGTSGGAAQGALPSAPLPAPTSQSGGFRWGDAGIGAACMLVLVVAGGGLAVNVRRRSHRRSLAAG